MAETPTIPPAKDKPLFTPGPLTTSMTVKQAMLRDLGSRDSAFIDAVARVRDGLLNVAGVSREDGYEAIPLQGSGTFGIEAVLTCAVGPDGKWLIVVNGAYGRRMAKIAAVNKLDHSVLQCPEDTPSKPADVDRALADEFDFRACQIDYLVSSANKCIEGVPGLTFCIARREALLKTAGWSRTVVLDLLDQWQGLERNGQFRFTPPTHVILAFERALAELAAEGGPAARAARYRANHRCIVDGMTEMGCPTPLLHNPGTPRTL